MITWEPAFFAAVILFVTILMARFNRRQRFRYSDWPNPAAYTEQLAAAYRKAGYQS